MFANNVLGDVETSDSSVCILETSDPMVVTCLCYDIPAEVEGICLFEGFYLSMHVFKGIVCV